MKNEMSNRVTPLPPKEPVGPDAARASQESRPTGTLGRLKQIFTKYIGWKRLGIAASLLIVIFAVTTLVRTLKGVDTWVIMTALTEIPPGHIAMAALCVLGAFGTLTFYDFFALRTIGKTHVPYRIAALSSFCSYTIGHNLGATVFTGGAIRFRIYSDYGLNAIDVAKICFISGLTFWLGNTFVLGIGMIWHPAAASAMDLLPDAINRLIGAGCIAGIAAYLIWLSMGQNRRQLGKDGWKVVLPSAKLTLLQIAIGVVDLGFCALAMYLLMPVAAADRFRLARGGVHPRDAARFRQPRAGLARRVRRRDAGRAAAVRTRRSRCHAGRVPDFVLHDPVRCRDRDHGFA